MKKISLVVSDICTFVFNGHFINNAQISHKPSNVIEETTALLKESFHKVTRQKQ